MIRRSIQSASLAASGGVLVQYAAFRLAGVPLWTDVIGEWIMARTPNAYSVWLLETLGAWAKPLAVTGGLFTLGILCWVVGLLCVGRRAVDAAIAAGLIAWVAGIIFEYRSFPGQLVFWAPAVAILLFRQRLPREAGVAGRRAFLATASQSALPALMSGSTALVAFEGYWRNQQAARRAAEPRCLFPFTPPVESFAQGLVRKAVTPVSEFYVMSKNAVDPTVDVGEWRLRILIDGHPAREVSYAELIALPRVERYATLRCISNTLRSNLMATGYWSGIFLRQLVDRRRLPADTAEVVVIGVDGHGDSYPLDYAFSGHVLLALGMNGQTLNRDHGFPVRLLTPRYFGFKNVKWIGEIRFVSKPYFGTWPRMGYTKEATIHTTSFIDRARVEENRIRVGGVSFAGDRDIKAVQIRADQGPWMDTIREPRLSPYTWTRWKGEIPTRSAAIVEARALDGDGTWQAVEPSGLFPSGVKGPTVKRLPS